MKTKIVCTQIDEQGIVVVLGLFVLLLFVIHLVFSVSSIILIIGGVIVGLILYKISESLILKTVVYEFDGRKSKISISSLVSKKAFKSPIRFKATGIVKESLLYGTQTHFCLTLFSPNGFPYNITELVSFEDPIPVASNYSDEKISFEIGTNKPILEDRGKIWKIFVELEKLSKFENTQVNYPNFGNDKKSKEVSFDPFERENSNEKN